MNADVMYKILLVGNAGTGKTEILGRYVNNTFNPSYVSTVGIDFRIKDIARQGKHIKLQIWDTAGQERYQSLTTAYYNGAMGFIIVFDLTNEDSFLSARKWFERVKQLALVDAQIVLVGNKCDLAESRVITKEQGMELAQSLGVEYFETSAKDDVNVKQTFETLVDLISEKMAESIEKNPNLVLQKTRSEASHSGNDTGEAPAETTEGDGGAI